MFGWAKRLFKKQPTRYLVGDVHAPIVHEPFHDAQRVFQHQINALAAQQQLGDMNTYGERLAQQEMANYALQAMQQAVVTQRHVQNLLENTPELNTNQALIEDLERDLGSSPTIFGMPLIETLDIFLNKLKISGMTDPELKENQLFMINPDVFPIIKERLRIIRSKSSRLRNMFEIVNSIKINATHKFRYTGAWEFDNDVGDYVISTDYSMYSIPLSIFIKLPGTIDECIETMEESLWSSRKSPIKKKDIV